jgi:hypothetical protein
VLQDRLRSERSKPAGSTQLASYLSITKYPPVYVRCVLTRGCAPRMRHHYAAGRAVLPGLDPAALCKAKGC